MNELIRKILMYIGILFLVYGLIVISLIGTGGVFNFFFPVSGAILIVLSFLMAFMDQKMFTIICAVLIGVFIIFAAVESMIISHSFKEPFKGADYVIVLGSQIRNDGPSIDYQARLDKAYEYLIDNPDTKVITTGAKGDNEPISEAQGGKDYLLKKGIDSSRIIVEDQSYNTLQNLNNTRRIIENDTDKKDVKVVIVSAIYHLYRASYIADKIGFKNISSTGGHGLWVLLPQYFTREFFGMVKEWIVLR